MANKHTGLRSRGIETPRCGEVKATGHHDTRYCAEPPRLADPGTAWALEEHRAAGSPINAIRFGTRIVDPVERGLMSRFI